LKIFANEGTFKLLNGEMHEVKGHRLLVSDRPMSLAYCNTVYVNYKSQRLSVGLQFRPNRTSFNTCYTWKCAFNFNDWTSEAAASTSVEVYAQSV